MRAFKRYGSAVKANTDGAPIIKVGGIYLVFDPGEIVNAETTELAVLRRCDRRSYQYSGQVTVRHLTRLGNANWAEPKSIVDALRDHLALP
jgi:hypothetical protein